MKAAMIKFDVKPERMDEFVGKVKALWSKIDHLPGIGSSIYLVSEPGTNSCMTFGVWDTPEQAELFAKNEDFIRFQQEVKPLLASEPVRKVCDVIATSSKSAIKQVA